MEEYMGTSASSSPTQAELEKFSWWFASEKFDLNWATKQAVDVLSRGAALEPDHLVAQYLERIVSAKPEESARILDGLVEAQKDSWSFLGWRKETVAILKGILQSGDVEGIKVARAVVSKLVARGYPEFKDLLERDGSRGSVSGAS